MKGLNYNTELTYDCPLLLERKSLEDLDIIIQKGYEKLMANNNKSRDLAVEERLKERLEYFKQKTESEIEIMRTEIKKNLAQYAWHKEYINVNAKLGENRYYSEDSLKKIIIAPELAKENISELKVKYGAGDINVTIEFESLRWRTIHLRTAPEDNEIARELFVELRDWVDKIKAPNWQKIWRKVKGFHWFIFIIFIFFISFLSLLTPTAKDMAFSTASAEAHKLLSSGLTKNDIPKAIELILRIESKYIPKGANEIATFPKWLYRVFFGGLTLSIILSFLPGLVIDIGKGHNKLKLWRLWLKFISYTLPGAMFTYILLPYILNLIKNSNLAK